MSVSTIEEQMREAVTAAPIYNEAGYCPTRLEYFAARALQGLVTGRSEKDRRSSVRDAIKLATELCESCDKAQD
jgi:hypothetical protein